jgi:hypothetical protein
MNLRRNFRRSKRGIGTIFGMVFFLLIVMIVIASLLIILNQNTGLQQTVIQTQQMDNDRATEQSTVSILNASIAVQYNGVVVAGNIGNSGPLSTQLVRLWIKDINTNQTSNMAVSIVLNPGSIIQYLYFVGFTNASPSDQFTLWFVTARGNVITDLTTTYKMIPVGSLGGLPNIDDVDSNGNGNSTLTLSLNAVNKGDLIYVAEVFDDDNSGLPPTSITSTGSVTWNQTLRALTQSTSSAGGDSKLETWYGIYASSGQINITLAQSLPNDPYWAAVAFAISGANTTSPFDNGNVPKTAVGGSATASASITTNNANDFVIGILGVDDDTPTIKNGTGFTQLIPLAQSSGGGLGGQQGSELYSLPRSIWAEYLITNTTKTGLSVNATVSSGDSWAMIADAVKLVTPPVTQLLTLSPTNGPIGTTVTVNGTNFAPNSRLLAVFGSSQVPFSATTDSTGTIPPGSTFTVPSGSAAGNYTVTIVDSSFNYENTTFQVNTPNITVSPTIGPVGTNVTVNGSNFISNSPININFDGNPIVTNPSTVTANVNGSFSTSFNLINDTAGAKQVLASDRVNSANATVNVTSSITLSPTNGPIGSNVTVFGYGFGYFQPVTVTFAGSTVATIPANTNTNGFGFFNASFTIPAGQTAGAKNVTAIDALSNAAYATFNVVTSISLNPNYGNAGSTVTVSGSGFASGSPLTATYTGTSLTLSGTTSTNATGGFSGATFTVPSSTAGGAQTVTITDASSNSANATFAVNTLPQKITVTLANSAPTATVTVNVGYSSPPIQFPADGTPYTINLPSGALFTLSFSNSGTTQDGFNVSSTFSATTSTYTASINSISVTAYEQVQNTFSAPFPDGNPGSGGSLTLTGTYLGAASSTIATLNSGNTWSTPAWSDYNTAVTFPASTSNSGSNEQWTYGSPYVTPVLTTGGNTYSPIYYNQYLQTLSYTVVGGGAPTAPTATGTALGVAYVPSLTNVATGYWFDASGSVTFSTSAGATGEQWAPGPANVAATSSHTQVVSMYHQYRLTASYTTSDGSTPSSAVILTGTALGSAYTPTLTTTAQQLWFDNGTAWSVNNQITSGTQRWIALSGYSGTVSTAATVAPSYLHQYQLTMIANFGTTNPVTGTWETAGSTVTITATAPTPVNGSEQYVWDGWTGTGTISYTGTNNPATNAVTMNGAITETAAWSHQYSMTLSFSVSGGSGYTAPTFNATRNGVYAPQVLTTTATAYWYDAGTSWTVTNPLAGGSGTTRWYTSQSTSGTVSVQTTAFAYAYQVFGVDTNCIGFGSESSSGSSPVQTTSMTAQANELIIVIVTSGHSGSGATHTFTVTDSFGTTYTQRGATVVSGTNAEQISEYYAFTGAHTGTFTVTATDTSGYGRSIDVLALGITGASTTNTFDTHAGLPYSNNNAGSSAPTVTNSVSTTNPTDMVLAFEGHLTATADTVGTLGGNAFSAPAAFLQNANGEGCNAEYQIESSALTSQTATFGTSQTNWVMMVDAVERAW